MDRGQLLQMILDALAVGVIATDPEGRVLYFNEEAARLTGVGPRPVAIEAWREAYGVCLPDGRTSFPAEDLPLARALRGELTVEVEMFLRNPEVPEVRWLAMSGRPIRDADGSILGAVVGVRDMGETVRGREAERTARQFLDSIIENVPDMIFVKDAKELRFERFNRAGEALLGMSRDQLLGRNDYDFFPEEQADFFTARDRETLAGKTLVDIPNEPIETAHGRRWLHTKKVPILDEDGEPSYLLGISEDITERRRVEAALRQGDKNSNGLPPSSTVPRQARS